MHVNSNRRNKLQGNSVFRVSFVAAFFLCLLSCETARAVELWATGENGTILHNSDGGATWNPQTSGTVTDLREVDFVDETEDSRFAICHKGHKHGSYVVSNLKLAKRPHSHP